MKFSIFFCSFLVMAIFSLSGISFAEEVEQEFSVVFDENTPLGVAISFLIDGEDYAVSHIEGASTTFVNGTFYGNSIEDIVSSIASASGRVASFNGGLITIE